MSAHTSNCLPPSHPDQFQYNQSELRKPLLYSSLPSEYDTVLASGTAQIWEERASAQGGNADVITPPLLTLWPWAVGY